MAIQKSVQKKDIVEVHSNIFMYTLADRNSYSSSIAETDNLLHTSIV